MYPSANVEVKRELVSQFCPSAMWFPQIGLRSSGLAASFHLFPGWPANCYVAEAGLEFLTLLLAPLEGTQHPPRTLPVGGGSQGFLGARLYPLKHSPA